VRRNGAALIAAVLLQGCFFEPGRPSASPNDSGVDGTGSGSGSGSGGPAPQVRLLTHAYYSSTGYSSGMTASSWAIATTGVHDNDLLLFIANIDNGSSDTWVLPSNFTQTAQNFFGTDGETYVAGYAIAHSEPPEYNGVYGGTNIHSASAVIMLLAVTGYDPSQPVFQSVDMAGSVGVDPVPLASDLMTNRANTLLVFAGGADWFNSAGAQVVSAPPTGYTTIQALTDEGGSHLTWTSLLTAYKVQPTAGDTGQHVGHLTSTPEDDGIPWTVEFAIPPPP